MKESLLKKLAVRYNRYFDTNTEASQNIRNIAMLILFRFNIVGDQELKYFCDTILSSAKTKDGKITNPIYVAKMLTAVYPSLRNDIMELVNIIQDECINYEKTMHQFLVLQEEYLQKMRKFQEDHEKYCAYELLLCHLLGSRVILSNILGGDAYAEALL